MGWKGEVLWLPPEEFVREANLTRYVEWLRDEKKMGFQVSYGDPNANVKHYNELWEWSVTELERFWESVWEYFKIKSHTPYTKVLSSRKMPGTRWFTGATLNFAEHAFANAKPGEEAVVCRGEDGSRRALSWEELARQTASVAATLRELGVGKGDRVAAYVTAVPESVVALLAAASIGAIWVGVGSELASRTVIDRFLKTEPKVLFAVDGYQYNGREFPKEEDVARIAEAVPSIGCVVLIPSLKRGMGLKTSKKVVHWDEAAGRRDGKLEFTPVEFNEPLWILFTSGTTGIPKPVVHSHGGILIEVFKAMRFHLDIKSTDRFHWYSTPSWMMWNANLATLFTGGVSVFYVGSPMYRGLTPLWELAEKERLTILGLSAPFIHGCMKVGLEPGSQFDLKALREVGSTAAPLSPEGFRWVYSKVKRDVWLNPSSGGTDVCSGFVGGCPILPVWAGEMQCRWLGAKVEVFTAEGRPVVGEVGELVVTEPMPSMPLYLWGDQDNKWYLEEYYAMFPNAWWHGDWIVVTERGTAIILGRSDSTIKRSGVRIGTLDVYRVVEAMPEVAGSLAVEVGGKLVLYVVLKPGFTLTEELKEKIREKMKSEIAPYVVPDLIIQVPDIPMTLNFKKLEVPVRKILSGWEVKKAVNLDNLMNPEALFKLIEATKPYLEEIRRGQG